MVEISSMLEQAKELEVQGRYPEADECLTSIIEEIEQSQEPLLANLLNQRGIVRRMLSQYDEAFKDYQTVLDLNSNNEQKALAHINIADIQRVAYSSFEDAHSSLDKAHNYLEQDSLIHAKALDQRGLVFMGQKQYDSAIDSYQEARRVCENLIQPGISDKDIENRFAQIILHLGGAYLFSEDFNRIDEAYDSQITALKIFTRLGDQQGIVNSVATIGKISLIKNDYDGAIAQYERAWEILEQTKETRSITALSLYLTEAYLVKEEPEKAKPYLERFVEGILQHEITEHDISLMKDQFNNVRNMYSSLNLKIDNFDVVQLAFK